MRRPATATPAAAPFADTVGRHRPDLERVFHAEAPAATAWAAARLAVRSARAAIGALRGGAPLAAALHAATAAGVLTAAPAAAAARALSRLLVPKR